MSRTPPEPDSRHESHPSLLLDAGDVLTAPWSQSLPPSFSLPPPLLWPHLQVPSPSSQSQPDDQLSPSPPRSGSSATPNCHIGHHAARPARSSVLQPSLDSHQSRLQPNPVLPDLLACPAVAADQECPRASKRRKVGEQQLDPISLLVSNEGSIVTAHSESSKEKKKKKKKRKRKRKKERKTDDEHAVESRNLMDSNPVARSVSTPEAIAKHGIKQRSSMSPAIPWGSPESIRRSQPPSSPLLPYSLPRVGPDAGYQTARLTDSQASAEVFSPPSSSPDAGPMPPAQNEPRGQSNPDEPPLCPEQAQLVELIASGRNVFYTGSAGCGKSTVLRAFTKRLRDMGKRVRILAPTGRAALQVNGVTTWTYAGWTPNHHKRSLEALREGAHGKFVSKRFRDTDVLVIDEISMVENLHFERLNEVMKEARSKSCTAFGGVQVIVTGDFCQLPPVKPFQHCIKCGYELVERYTAAGRVHVCKRHGEYRDEDKWAFRSKAWQECDFIHVHLNTIHRQNDETFIRILQKCRIGRQLSTADIELLMNHECMVHHATKLFATREEAATVNRAEFERLKTVNHTYWCLDTFKWKQKLHPHLGWKGMRKPKGPQSEGPLRALEEHRYDECVQLKKGMLVVLLVNLDLDAGLCNGSQGIICGFEPYNQQKLPKISKASNNGDNGNTHDAASTPGPKFYGEQAALREEEVRRFVLDPGVQYKTWPVVRFHNGTTRTVYADCSVAELGDEWPYSLLVRTQIPLAPAWAMTIHKSQSLTLDRVIVNLSRAFEEGQVYVALSRATGLRGLKIEGGAGGLSVGLGGNPEVRQFLREKFQDLAAAQEEDEVASSPPVSSGL